MRTMMTMAVAFGLIAHWTVGESRPTNSFGIYLFAEAPSRSNWMSRALSPKPLISDADIVTYAFTNHLLTLTPEAAQRIAHFRMPQLTEPFIVVANGERIYRGALVSSSCSQSFALPSITLWGSQQFTIHTNLPPNSVLIDRTYAEPFSQTGPDPRSDERIRRALDALRKLK